MFYIGCVRRSLFIRGTWRWNCWVREATAWLEMYCPKLIRSDYPGLITRRALLK